MLTPEVRSYITKIILLSVLIEHDKFFIFIDPKF